MSRVNTGVNRKLNRKAIVRTLVKNIGATSSRSMTSRVGLAGGRSPGAGLGFSAKDSEMGFLVADILPPAGSLPLAVSALAEDTVHAVPGVADMRRGFLLELAGSGPDQSKVTGVNSS